MSAQYVFAVEGLDGIGRLEDVPAAILKAARQAVNKTTDRARTAAAAAIRSQVNLPASYLGPSAGRLTVAKRATSDDLEGIVRGRQRPTSLARFVRGSLKVGPRKKGDQGPTVEVKPGTSKKMKGAFLIKLKAGSSSLDTQFNLGLAVRTKNGQKPRTAFKPMPIGRGLWLLYGPSVDQVFRSVAPEMVPSQTDFLETEFRRLLELQNA